MPQWVHVISSGRCGDHAQWFLRSRLPPGQVQFGHAIIWKELLATIHCSICSGVIAMTSWHCD